MKSQALLVVPLAMLAAACGSSSSSSNTTNTGTTTTTASTSTAATRITTQRVPGIGAVLANWKGLTLYVYTPEKGGKVVCTGTCASAWPPLLLPQGLKAEATSSVHPNLVGSVTNPSGGSVATYADYPLHTYTADTGRGSYKGQGYAGKWYMISPSGQVITKPVSSGGSGITSGY
jgi:predicted lipoprotein with Yx(FWY)xxD motif